MTFECKSITPIFMYGADGKRAELRPASIKGVMRFWWRAIHGNIGDIEKLKTVESEIFGSTDKKSSFTIRVKEDLTTEQTNPLPHKKQGARGYHQKEAFKSNQTFQVTFGGQNLELIKNLFILAITLGGFGQRSRRGFGSVQIIKIDDKNFTPLKTLEKIKTIISKINKEFKYESKINYPYIKEIEIGKRYDNFQQLLDTVGKATHTHNDDALGYAKKEGRLSSPIYVSVIKDNKKYLPIITTLNNTKSNSDGKINDFKKAIL